MNPKPIDKWYGQSNVHSSKQCCNIKPYTDTIPKSSPFLQLGFQPSPHFSSIIFGYTPMMNHNSSLYTMVKPMKVSVKQESTIHMLMVIYHPFMVNLGMIYYCFINIISQQYDTSIPPKIPIPNAIVPINPG